MHIGSSDDSKAVEEDVPALMLSKTIKIKELVKRYGDTNSDKVFSLYDYKMYLLNNYLGGNYNATKELEALISVIED